MARKSNTSTTQIDKSSYFFAFQCGICHPGGGPLQYDRDGRKYWDGAQFGYAGGVAALPAAAKLDGDYSFIVPKDGPGGVPAAGTPVLANGWKKNGVIEADCLLCHLQGYNWKNRAATLTAQGVATDTAGQPLAAFKVAPAVGAGWGTVTIAATPAFPPTGTAVGPVNYALGLANGSLVVNADNQLEIALGKVGATPEANCRGCHSTPDTKKSGRTLNDTNDVHKAAGVTCTACHALAGSNPMEHQIGKGDITIGSVRDDLDNTVRSCAACHLEGAYPGAPDPRNAHVSIPSLHFAAMTCQACHIRYLEDDVTIAGIQAPELIIEMTSTGTQTISTWDKYFKGNALDPSQTDAALAAAGGTAYRWYPAIRNWRGKYTTVKPLITAYYGDWVGGSGDDAIIRPIPLRFARKALTGVYGQGSPRLAALPLTAGGLDPANPIPFRKSDIQALLVAMRDAVDTANTDPAASNDIVVKPVLVRSEKIYYLNDAGEVEWFHSAVAESHDFAINHNVVAKRDLANPVLRPGPYGAGGCGDCHSKDSTFFYARQLVEPAQYEYLDEQGTIPNPDAGKPLYADHWEAMGYSAARVAQLTGAATPVTVQLLGWGPGSTVAGGGIDCRFAGGTCQTAVDDGATLTLVATPGTGAVVKSWTGCTPSADLATCAVTGSAADGLGGTKLVSATFGMADPTPAPVTSGVMVTVTGSGWGTVSGPGIVCNSGTQGACNAEVAAGQTVVLTATPGPNTWLYSWSGCTSSSGNQCTVNVSAIHQVKAVFTNGTVGNTVSVNMTGTGAGSKVRGGGIDCAFGSGTCKVTLPANAAITLELDPGIGYAVRGTPSGCTSIVPPQSGDVSRAMSCVVQVGATDTSSKLVSVQFGIPDPKPAPTVSGINLKVVGTGSGTVEGYWGVISGPGISCIIGNQGSCAAEIPNGTPVTLTAFPGSNTWLAKWDGCTPTSANSCALTIDGIHDVKATFSNGSGGGIYSETQTLSVSMSTYNASNLVTGPNIACRVNGGTCKAVYDTGTTVTLTAVPAAGSTFTSWTGCSTVSGTQCTVLMNNVKSVRAKFTP